MFILFILIYWSLSLCYFIGPQCVNSLRVYNFLKQSFLVLHTYPSPISSPSPDPPTIPPHTLLREGKTSHGMSDSPRLHFEAGPRHLPLYIQVEQGIPQKKKDSKSTVHTLGRNPCPTISGHKDGYNHISITRIQRPQFGPMQVPPMSVQSQ